MLHTFIDWINIISTFLFSIVYSLLRILSPFWSLTVISLLIGIFMIWIFGKVSNQYKIKRVKDKIRANLLAIRLFREDLGVFFRIQGRILGFTFSYMKLSLLPMMVMIIPLLLIIIQLNLHYSVRPLQEGEGALVKVKVTNPELLIDPSTLVLHESEGFMVETPAVRIPSQNEIAWRIRGKREGKHTLNIQVGDSRVTKSLIIGDGRDAVSLKRTGENILDMLLYPAETAIDPLTSVESVVITYSSLEIVFLGWKMNWLVQFFIMSIGFGFAIKGLFGVQV